ncbi:MAG: hypothetical protein R3F51_22460 [Cyanobacteriota/Melainabacteria group bacterium]
MFSETFSIQPERMSRWLAWGLWGVATLLMLVSARQVEMALAMSTRTSGLTTWLTAGAIVAGLFWCQLATVYFVLQRSSIFYSVLYSGLTFLLSGCSMYGHSRQKRRCSLVIGGCRAWWDWFLSSLLLVRITSASTLVRHCSVNSTDSCIPDNVFPDHLMPTSQRVVLLKTDASDRKRHHPKKE